MLNTEKTLASREGLGSVYECACGTIHVAVGPVNLAFTRESFLQAFAMLRNAVARMEACPTDAVH